MDMQSLEYFANKIRDDLRIAEDYAASGDNRGAIYRLTDALGESLRLIEQLAKESVQ